MSQAAREAFQHAQSIQLQRIHARRIRSKVDQAEESSDAAARWPFELLQNACDAGPRPGSDAIRVRVDWARGNGAETEVSFEHDGAPFSFDELAALLSGGSSKDYESEDTTGRFGTGFLVTHVLSTHTEIEGVFTVDGQAHPFERFSLALDRGGDEEEILKNIQASVAAVEAACAVHVLDGRPSARFTYRSRTSEPLVQGLAAFEAALPYVFSTCPLLIEVVLRRADGQVETWRAAPPVVENVGADARLARRRVQVLCDDEKRVLESLRFFAPDEPQESVLVVAQSEGDGWRTRLPGPDMARLFRRFPLRRTSRLPLEVVLDGLFDVTQERETARVKGKPETQRRVRSALALVPAAVAYCVKAGVADAHRLARLDRLDDVGDSELDPEWWQEALGQAARELASMPLVSVGDGPSRAACPEAGGRVVFPVAAVGEQPTRDEVAFTRMWALVEAVEGLTPAEPRVAEEWTRIARGWARLGARPTFVSVGSLATRMRERASTLSDLPVPNPLSWYREFLGVVGTCWKSRNAINSGLLDALVPNQRGELRSPADLRRDHGIDDSLKTIAGSLGEDSPGYLLHCDVEAEEGAPLGLRHALSSVIHEGQGEEQLLGRCRDLLQKRLDGKTADEVDAGLISAATSLVRWLAVHRAGGKGANVARELPYLTTEGRFVRWNSKQVLMAPASAWHPDARPFVAAYPDGRVLREDYHEAGAEVVPALSAWGIAHPDPLVLQTPALLKARRVRALTKKDRDHELDDSTTLKGVEFSTIALLATAIVPSCQQRPDKAKALLGLVLRYAAVHDPRWQEWGAVTARSGGEDIPLELRGALWVADLRHRPWVPVQAEDDDDGGWTPAPATPGTLEAYVEPAWLENNELGITLLTECFGFDALHLRLLAVAPDEGDRKAVRDTLASIVEAAGGDVGLLERLESAARRRQEQQGQVNRWRAFGLAVQAAVQAALEEQGLEVEVVDRGFDFEVSVPLDSELDPADLGGEFEVGGWLVEVKATTGDEVKLTPAQASTAAAEAGRYVVCVVPMSAITEGEKPESELVELASERARFVTNIGGAAARTTSLVQNAVAERVGVRGEGSLRYAVKKVDWTSGLSLAEWVATLSVAECEE